jgi:hypothetical protein
LTTPSCATVRPASTIAGGGGALADEGSISPERMKQMSASLACRHWEDSFVSEAAIIMSVADWERAAQFAAEV